MLEPLGFEPFTKALEAMGKSRDDIGETANASGRSLTVLRRQLSNIPAIPHLLGLKIQESHRGLFRLFLSAHGTLRTRRIKLSCPIWLRHLLRCWKSAFLICCGSTILQSGQLVGIGGDFENRLPLRNCGHGLQRLILTAFLTLRGLYWVKMILPSTCPRKIVGRRPFMAKTSSRGCARRRFRTLVLLAVRQESLRKHLGFDGGI